MEMGYILGPLSAITELFLNTSEEIVGKHAPARVIVIYTTTLVLWTSEICLLKKIRSTIVYMLSYFSGQNTLGQSDPLCPIKVLLYDDDHFSLIKHKRSKHVEQIFENHVLRHGTTASFRDFCPGTMNDL